MDVITDKPSIAAEESASKELLPNSLVRNSSTAALSEEVMQVDDELPSSADRILEDNKLTV